MSDPIEILKVLREKKVKMLEAYQGQLQGLQADLQGVKCQISGIDESIKELSAAIQRPDTNTASLFKKYEGVALTPAVLDVIEHADNGMGLLVPEIIQKLTQEGFKTDAENLYASVYSVAMRLVKQAKINQGKVDGKRVFVKKHPF